MAKHYEYEVIYHQSININSIKRNVGEIFSTEETKEIKTLLYHNYIKKTGGK